MTAEEAIKEFKERIELGKKEYLKDIPEYIEALDMAIEALEKVEELKRLEEQGRLIKLPCKVGDTVYRIGEYKIYEPSKESEQREWGLVREECKIYEQPFSLYDLRLIGKTVFLTREEAEQKLKEMAG